MRVPGVFSCADCRLPTADRRPPTPTPYRSMDINKDLIAASSTPIVLSILAEGDSYGYAIIQRVREISGGRMTWTDGMLYPVLHRLERLGHVESRWESAGTARKRKYYRITPQGEAQLAEERRQWQAVDATLRGIWGTVAMPAPAPTFGWQVAAACRTLGRHVDGHGRDLHLHLSRRVQALRVAARQLVPHGAFILQEA